MRRFGPFIVFVAILCTGCAPKEDSDQLVSTRPVTLPDGAVIQAEVKVTGEEMARGMMFRDSLASDKGMLFIHSAPGTNAYWMHNCHIALDIIWMNPAHRVVEISANTPPCQAQPRDCPSYGGHFPAQYVLELGSGEARKHSVDVGKTLSF